MLRVSQLHGFNKLKGGDPYWDNVVLLMHMDNNLVDEKGHTVTTAVGTSFNTVNKKFGTASIAVSTFDQNYQSTSTDYYLSGFDWTVEAWLYRANPDVNLLRTTGGTGIQWYVDGSGYLRINAGGETSIVVSSVVVPLSSWAHIAATRQSGTVRLFINGVTRGTATGDLTNNATLNIVSTLSSADNYVDELRITKGVARYTSDFTPPTKAFPNS